MNDKTTNVLTKTYKKIISDFHLEETLEDGFFDVTVRECSLKSFLDAVGVLVKKFVIPIAFYAIIFNEESDRVK